MRTQNIELTPLDLNNAKHMGCMFNVRTHPSVCTFMPGSPPKNFLEHVQYLYNVKNKVFFLIGNEEELFGYCQATFGLEEIELGWAIAPQYWGKGIGTEAVRQLIETVLPHGKRIVLYVRKNNPRAIALYKKYNFKITEERESTEDYKMELSGDPEA